MPGKKFKIRLCLFLVFIMILMVAAPAAAAFRPTETKSMIVGFNGAPGAAERGLMRAFGAKILTEYTLIPAMHVEIPAQALAGLQNHPLIRYVEEDIAVYAIAETVPWGIDRVKAPQVWNSVQGAGVNVAVLDTGIGPHPDLELAGGAFFIETNYDDGNGHGTHVAGTIAALGNGSGVIGAAPAANLYAVKVLNSSGSGSLSTVISGIQWAANTRTDQDLENDIHIINMSLGASSGSTSLEAACNAAYNAGILLVAAAGNSGTPSGKGDSVGYPAKYASVIAVAATDENNLRATFSSTGPAVEIAAPGTRILSTYLKGGYATLSGTSMASPHVAGVAALMKAANPALTNVQIRDYLTQSAAPLSQSASLVGAGLVDASAAVAMATAGSEPPAPPPPPPDTTQSMSSVINFSVVAAKNLVVSVTVTAEDGTPVAGANVSMSVVRTEGGKWELNGLTDSSGKVSLTIKRAAKGTYTATIDSIVRDGYLWTGDTETKEYIY
jgi:subtilisin family serine protease